MLIVWFLSIKNLPNLLFGVLCLPGDQSHPFAQLTINPLAQLHLLGWFIGSCGFSSSERRPEFWVLQYLFIWLGWVLAVALRICDLRWGMQDLKLQHGAGNGISLQDACLETPMDGGAWWAAAHGSLRVGHDWATSLSLFTFMHWRRKWQPTPVFLPGESQGQEPDGLPSPGPAQSRTRLKRLSSSSSKLHTACGWNPGCLQWELGVLATGIPGKSQEVKFYISHCLPVSLTAQFILFRKRSLTSWTEFGNQKTSLEISNLATWRFHTDQKNKTEQKTHLQNGSASRFLTVGLGALPREGAFFPRMLSPRNKMSDHRGLTPWEAQTPENYLHIRRIKSHCQDAGKCVLLEECQSLSS